MPTLTELADRYGSDKGSRHGDAHRYTELYETLFAPLRERPLHLLEIGLCRRLVEGHPQTETPSLAIWLAYFPRARVTGFDIQDFAFAPRQLAEHFPDVHERLRLFRGDQGKPDDLQAMLDALNGTEANPDGLFDIVIDDGSHVSQHQQQTLAMLLPAVVDGGYYVIEDLQWQPAPEPGVTQTREALRSLRDTGRFQTNVLDSKTRDHIEALTATIWLQPSATRGADALGIFKKRPPAYPPHL